MSRISKQTWVVYSFLVCRRSSGEYIASLQRDVDELDARNQDVMASFNRMYLCNRVISSLYTSFQSVDYLHNFVDSPPAFLSDDLYPPAKKKKKKMPRSSSAIPPPFQ